MQLPTWDVFISLAFVIGVAYGFILRREKTITTLLSTYIGLVIASSFSDTIFSFFQGDTVIANQVWIKSNASLSTISIAVFLISTLLVSGSINSSSTRSGDTSPLEVILFSALNVTLIISSILGFLPEEVRATTIEGSKAASTIFAFRTWWVIVPPVALVIMNFRRK